MAFAGYSTLLSPQRAPARKGLRGEGAVGRGFALQNNLGATVRRSKLITTARSTATRPERTLDAGGEGVLW